MKKAVVFLLSTHSWPGAHICSSLAGQWHCASKRHHPVRCHLVSLVIQERSSHPLQHISNNRQKGRSKNEQMRSAAEGDTIKHISSRELAANPMTAEADVPACLRMTLANLRMTRIRALIKSDPHIEIKNWFPTSPRFPFHCTKAILKLRCFLLSRKVIVSYPFPLKENEYTEGIPISVTLVKPC